MYGQCSLDAHEHVVIHATLQPQTKRVSVTVTSVLCTIDGTVTLDQAQGTFPLAGGADYLAQQIHHVADRLTRESVERTLAY